MHTVLGGAVMGANLSPDGRKDSAITSRLAGPAYKNTLLGLLKG